MGDEPPCFSQTDTVRSPVVIAVPHAGQDYPPEIERQLRQPVAALRALEDRHAGLLADAAEAAGHHVLRMPVPRLMIDLNRHEDEVDPDMVGEGRAAMRFRASVKVRGGLGLIPTRLGGVGALWKQPFSAQEVAKRIRQWHVPWHRAIADALAARTERFGTAVLIDLHSMPSIRDWRQSGPVPLIVLGDLFGKSMDMAVMAGLEAELRATGLAVTRNHPYSGGYTLDRHGAPHKGVHAVQLEVDRALYLDRNGDAPGPGLATLQQLVLRMADHLASPGRQGWPLAAE